MELESLLQKLDSPVSLKIVVLSGAGISAESGLSTFRDKYGMWTKYDWEKLASAAGFYEDPQAVLDFYNMRRKRLLEVEPNLAHNLLAMINKYHEVHIVTQNVDNLHERAGTTNVVHLHGELTKVTSSKYRFVESFIKEYPLDVPIRLGDTADDVSQLRPYIVWFGEFLNENDLHKAKALIKSADVFLVIGTSLRVYPAASLARYAYKHAQKFVIDPADLGDRLPEGFTHIKEPASTGMITFIEELVKLVDIYKREYE